jgi:preprotein translocase subunit SecE
MRHTVVPVRDLVIVVAVTCALAALFYGMGMLAAEIFFRLG